jgi:hypothetical protein
MAKVRQLLIAASVETAKRKRVCYRKRKNHEIAAGEKCLVVNEGSGNGRSNYCREHASEILDRAGADLTSLKKNLDL